MFHGPATGTATGAPHFKCNGIYITINFITIGIIDLVLIVPIQAGFCKVGDSRRPRPERYANRPAAAAATPVAGRVQHESETARPKDIKTVKYLMKLYITDTIKIKNSSQWYEYSLNWQHM